MGTVSFPLAVLQEALARRVTGTALVVLVAILGNEAQGSLRISAIATATGLQRHSIMRAVRRLEHARLVRVDRRKGAPSRYLLTKRLRESDNSTKPKVGEDRENALSCTPADADSSRSSGPISDDRPREVGGEGSAGDRPEIEAVAVQQSAPDPAQRAATARERAAELRTGLMALGATGSLGEWVHVANRERLSVRELLRLLQGLPRNLRTPAAIEAAAEYARGPLPNGREGAQAMRGQA